MALLEGLKFRKGDGWATASDRFVIFTSIVLTATPKFGLAPGTIPAVLG
jgi:hypothetical protein